MDDVSYWRDKFFYQAGLQRGERCEEFYQLDSHPVVVAVGEEFEQLGSKREVVFGVSAGEFADYVDGCGDDAGVFVIKTFSESWPTGTEEFGGLEEAFIED